MVLPKTDLEGAVVIAESMRARVERLNILHENSKTANYVTLSLGVATVRPSPRMHPADLVGLADKLLYQAKQKGRNRCEQAHNPQDEPVLPHNRNEKSNSAK